MKLTKHELLILISLTKYEFEFLKKLPDELFGCAVKDSEIIAMYELNKKLSDELDKRGDKND